MNIWKVIANEGYNNAFLIDSTGRQCFDPDFVAKMQAKDTSKPIIDILKDEGYMELIE